MKRTIALFATALALSTPIASEAKKHGPHYLLAAQQGGQLTEQRVERYIVDTFGDVDGLLLSDGWIVKFPKHQSADLTRVARPGDAIAATGAMIGPRVMEAWTLTNAASNTMIVRTPKSKLQPKLPKHVRAASLRPMEASGRIAHVIPGKKGEIKSVVLEDGTSLRLGKHAQWVIGTQLSVGREVTARGVGTQNELGRGLEVTELGVDGAPMVALYGTAR